MRALFCRIFCLLCLLLTLSVSAQARTPLLVEGKTSLFQRVITHPGAAQLPHAGAVTGKAIPAFTPLYVYDRREQDGKTWLEVAPESSAQATFWLDAALASPWDKALTLLFADRMSREPVFFFENFKALNSLVSSADMAGSVARLKQLHRDGKSDEAGLLAMEPDDKAVPRNNFYLMPIFDFSTEYDAYNLRLLKVGCINPGAQTASPAPAPRLAKDFKAGIAFIVDTTISMGPYIEQTKQFIVSAFDSLEKSPIADDVSFGLLGFRNSTRHDSRLEYVARVVAPLTHTAQRKELESSLDRLAEATVSTHSFNEDAFAGIKTALDALDWQPYAVRIAVLITDAGAVRNDDPLSTTGFNEQEMAMLLAQKGVRLVVVHLQTPAARQHQPAQTRRQYESLTAMNDARVKSTYIAIPADSSAKAAAMLRRVATALVDVVQKIIGGMSAGTPLPRPQQAAGESPEQEAARMAAYIGYAAQLEFLGRNKNAQAPGMIEAWVADKDLPNLVEGRATAALEVAVLLNKSQLESLARNLQMMVDSIRNARSAGSRDFFQNLVSLAAQTLRDPNLMQRRGNLVQRGLLPEFLEGLPYRSAVLNLDEQRWAAMSAREQDDLVHGLESKLRLYKEYHDDVSNWQNFGSSDPAEALYRVPLAALP